MVDPESPVAASAFGAGKAVLVSGASFAGLSTAFWMAGLGYAVTVVETAAGLRKGGTPVDIEGPTIEILRRMGLLDAVRAKALPPRSLEFKDVDDRTVGGMPASTAEGEPNMRYEIHRDDLLEILFASVEATSEVRFGRSIARLDDRPDRVQVTFDDGAHGDYALVLGCDGARSNTRRLAFADAATSSYFLGCYFFLKVVPTTGLVPANVTQILSVPGRTVLLNGYDDRTDIGLAFRTARELDYDHRSKSQQRRMIHDHFDGLGWKVSDLLEHVDADDAFYFDKVNQIRMPAWSNGRVALVGDAGYCVSPAAGFGGSMAIIGAAALADALRSHGGDHVAGFRDYDLTLRPFVDQVQDKAVRGGHGPAVPDRSGRYRRARSQAGRGRPRLVGAAVACARIGLLGTLRPIQPRRPAEPGGRLNDQ